MMKKHHIQTRSKKKKNTNKDTIGNIPITVTPSYGFYLTWSTLSAVLIIFFLGILAFATELNLLFWATSVAFAMFIISILTPGRNVNAVRIRKVLPDSGIMGQPLTLRYTVENIKNYAIYSVKLIELIDRAFVPELPRCYIPYLGGGDKVSFNISVNPIKRGKMKLFGTRVGSSFPFGILTRFITVRNKAETTIYPALGKLTVDLVSAQKNMDFFAGATASHVKGLSDEFYALREYRYGDNPKLIHWKRSAGMGILVVREMTSFSPMRLTVILNTYMPAKFDESKFEEAISFAATLLCVGLENQFRVSLICTTQPVSVIPPIIGREAQHRILTLLSEISPIKEKDILTESIMRMNFTKYWKGYCILVSLSEPSNAVVSKLTHTIGMTQIFTPEQNDWNKIFIPPEILARKDEA